MCGRCAWKALRHRTGSLYISTGVLPSRQKHCNCFPRGLRPRLSSLRSVLPSRQFAGHIILYLSIYHSAPSAGVCKTPLLASHITIPAVTLTFNECFVPCCGISTTPSQASTTSCRTPFTSLPRTREYFFYFSKTNAPSLWLFSACSTASVS